MVELSCVYFHQVITKINLNTIIGTTVNVVEVMYGNYCEVNGSVNYEHRLEQESFLYI